MNIIKLKRVVVKEEYVAITGDMIEAIILNQFVYWSERSKDFDKFINEEKERFEKFGNNATEDMPNMDLSFGWIYKKAIELKEEIMSTDSEKTINRKLTSLVEKGFLDRRNNPKIKYDRTYQYRVNFENIMKAMVDNGYMLQDYKVNLNFIVEALKTDKGQNDESQGQNVSGTNTDIKESQRQIDALKNQIDELKKQNVLIKNQEVGAIPEITTKTTIETTTEKDKGNNTTPPTPINLTEQFYTLIKNEISDVSFKTWIEPLLIHIEKKTAIIEIKNKFTYEIIKDRYISLIENSFKEIGISKVELKE